MRSIAGTADPGSRGSFSPAGVLGTSRTLLTADACVWDGGPEGSRGPGPQLRNPEDSWAACPSIVRSDVEQWMVMPTSYAQRERVALADLFDEVGPDAPTLCDGWHARELAAHLIIREHRLDTLPGIMISSFSGYTDRVLAKQAARPFSELVAEVRSGPPAWSPTRLPAVDTMVNTAEFFIHHEDVRRARDGWEPRPEDPAFEHALAIRLAQLARLSLRHSPIAIRLEPVGKTPLGAKPGPDVVTVVGAPSELTLFVSGRADHARVEVQGSADAVAKLEQSPPHL